MYVHILCIFLQISQACIYFCNYCKGNCFFLLAKAIGFKIHAR